MKKAILTMLIVLLALTTVFAQGAQEQKQQDVTVRMWTFIDPEGTGGRNVALKQMITEFEAENPGVHIVVEPKTHTTMTAEFLAAASTGTAPDIMWCSSGLLFGCIANGLLEPYENLFMKDWTAEQIADVDDAFFKFGEKDGKHYTLSLSKNAITLYYRSDLLEAAGCKVPTTFEELYEVAKKCTDSSKGVYGFGMQLTSGDYPLVTNYILSKQDSLFNADGTANFATEAGVEAMKYIKRFIDEGITPYEAISKSGEDINLEFQAGKYAMMAYGFVRVGQIKSGASYNPDYVKVAPVPTGSWIDGWHVGVWSGSKVKEWAGKFVEKMYEPASDLLWVNLGAQAPVRQSTKNLIEITDANDYIAVAGEIFGTGYNIPNDKSYEGVKEAFYGALQKYIVNGMDPLQALKEAEEQFNKTNNR